MSETVFVTMEDQSPKCPRPQMMKIESTPRRSSKQWQDHDVIHHDVLHKVHHSGMTTSQHKTRDHVTWHKHSGKTLPHNLFFEGFKDCASEVIRFLTEVKKVEDNNPLVQGLQTHLVNVSRAICQESINDLEQNGDVQQGKELRLSCGLNTRSLPDADCTVHDELMIDCSRSAQHLPCALSPIVMRSSNTSVSDMSYSESDMSTSCSSNVACQSLSSELSSSLNNSSAELNPDSSLDYIKNDDVFPCLSPQQMFRSDPTVPKLHKNRVLSLQQLASIAVPKDTAKIDKNNSEFLAETNLSAQLCLPRSERAGYGNEEDSIPNSMGYLLPLGQSSPVLTKSQSHSSSRSQLHNSPTNHFFSHGQIPNVTSPTCLLLEHSSSAVLQTQTFSQLPPISNRAFLAPSHVSSLAERSEAPVQLGLECRPGPLQLTTDISQYMASILDPHTSFLPGIDISSVDSGSFADILLAVESCRFHEEPRVRALANELINLIHDEYSDEDDDTDEEDHEDETNRNDESGVEMMDENSDWGNPADMIEQ